MRLVTYNDGMKNHTSTLSDFNCGASCNTKFKFCFSDHSCEETDKLEDSGVPTTIIILGEMLWPVNATLNVTALGINNTVYGEFHADIAGLLPAKMNWYTASEEYVSIDDTGSKAIDL